MIEASEITQLHQKMVALWHDEEMSNPYTGFLQIVCQQHTFNFVLWHEEDIARSPNVTDSRIAAVKRAIDRYNQQRNDCIEKIDDFLVDQLHSRGIVAQAEARLNTETPGSTIDRLSILALRLYHMREQADRADASREHRDKAHAKLAILVEQHHDLSAALGELLDDVFAGRKRLKVYRQFKMYNDPALNPYLYQASGANAGGNK
jgi:hypothetical protein